MQETAELAIYLLFVAVLYVGDEIVCWFVG